MSSRARRSRLALVLLMVGATLLAGCAEPSEEGGDPPSSQEDPTQGQSANPVTTRMASPPDVRLLVTDLGERTATVEVANERETPLLLARERFEFVDGSGASFRVNASATDALDDPFPEQVELAPGTNVSGSLAFDLSEVTMPVRLVYEDEAQGVEAGWFLHSSDYEVTLEPGDDTSFGAPIVAPANATFQYQVHGATNPVDVCLILEADHATWHSDGTADGFACRSDVTSADVSAAVPPGEYNLGMYCRSETEPCTFTVTVVLAW